MAVVDKEKASKIRVWQFSFIAFATIVALAVAIFLGGLSKNRFMAAENQLENNYTRSFNNLAGNIQEMQCKLGKLRISSKLSSQVFLLTDIWRLSDSAQDNLSQLPSTLGERAQIMRFINQVGDYCYQLSQKAARGTPLSSAQDKTLETLYNQAKSINQGMLSIAERLREGDLQWVEMMRQAQKNGQKPAEVVEKFGNLDKLAVDYPAPIYDGPFSETLLKAKPKGLIGKPLSVSQVTQEVQRLWNWKVEYTGKVEGLIECYRYSVKLNDNRNGTLLMTNTGKPLLLTSDLSIAVSLKKANIEAMKADGRKLLENMGFTSMVSTYWDQTNDYAIINYAYIQDHVICYPDLVKVKIDNNGSIIGFDARNYWMAHVSRKLPAPNLTQDQAKSSVRAGLDIQKLRLVVIPTQTGQEVQCYEMTAQRGGEIYLIYLNAQTGEEEDILQLIQVEEGQLTQ